MITSNPRAALSAVVRGAALRIWKSEDAALDFFYRAHPLLDMRRPIEVIEEGEDGTELVKAILGRLEYGTAP